MLLHPRKRPRAADEPVSPAEIAEAFFAMGLMAWMIARVPFLWGPPLWVLSLLSPIERPPAAKLAPAREARVAAIAPPPAQPPIATPLQASPALLPRTVRTPRPRPRPRRKEPR